MSRVTETEVKQILDESFKDWDLTPFITTANLLITKVFEDDDDTSDDLLKQMELWLSAHYACLRAPRAAEEVIGGDARASEKKQGTTGMGFQSTLYGQAALDLDTTGKLASAGRRKASVEHIG